ncbi:MAG: phage tail tip lysozyme [Nanoarchaeota archaeon]|nr:phage tail tip lysozyme [Nanoarchaeota archaeon]
MGQILSTEELEKELENEFESKSDEVSHYLKEAFGDSNAVVAGIMGNIDHETGGSFDYKQKQYKGKAEGLFQFENKSMIKAYKNYLDTNESTDSAESQINFMKNIVDGDEYYDIGAGNRKKVKKAFDTGNIDTITDAFSDHVERPGKPQKDKRRKASKKWLDELGSLINPFATEAEAAKIMTTAELEGERKILSTEELFKAPDPRDELSLLQKALTSKPANIMFETPQFFSNIKESFKRGQMASTIDQTKYLYKTGQLRQEEVKALVDKQEEILKADPIQGKNVISNALYSVSGMLPAMIEGTAEGLATGGMAGLTALSGGITAPAALPMFAAGNVVGSMSYWYRQGSGDIYYELKKEKMRVPCGAEIDGIGGTDGICYDYMPDSIAQPVSDIAGSMYAAIEFSQVDKLIPGSKNASKKLLAESLKKTIKRFAVKYGVNWVNEVGEEGLQEIVLATAEEVATHLAQGLHLPQKGEGVGEYASRLIDKNKEVFKKVMLQGWEVSKESMLPMAMLMLPGAGMEVASISKEEKMKGEVRKEIAKRVIDEGREEQIKKEIEDIKGKIPKEEDLPPVMTDAEGKKIPLEITPKEDRRKFNKGKKKSEADLVYANKIASVMRRVKGGVRINDEIANNFPPEDRRLLKKRSKKDGIIEFNIFASGLRERFPILSEKSDMDIARMVIDQERGLAQAVELSDNQQEAAYDEWRKEHPEKDTKQLEKEESEKIEKEKWDEEELEEAVTGSEKDSEKIIADKEAEGIEEIRTTIKELETEDLEKLIDERYNKGASQQELDVLEAEYEKRSDIAPEDVGEADQVDVGLSLEEILANTYKSHFIDKDQTYGSDANFAASARSNLSHPQLKTGFTEADVSKMTDEEVIQIAKDAYDRMAKKREKKGGEVDTKQILKDLGDALGGKEGSTELSPEGKKKQEAARKRLAEEHIPMLMAKAKEKGLDLGNYLKEFTNFTAEQIKFLAEIPDLKEKAKAIPEGKGKVHGLSKSVADQAIEDGIISEFGDLPTYATRNMEEVAKRASALIEKDYDLAVKIALGEAPEQGDVRSSEIYTALRIKAFTDGDVDTIEMLALSKTAISLATELGQRVKAYDSRLSFDPVRTIQEVVKKREDSKKVDSKKEKEIAELKKKLDETETKIKDLEAKVEKAKAERTQRGAKKFGSNNKIFTQSRLDEARVSLKKKLSGLHSGIDPTAVIELTEIGGFYFEGGLRTFGEWSQALIKEFGDSIKPHLATVWKNMKAEYSAGIIEASKKQIGKMAEEGDSLPKPFVVQRIAEEMVDSGVASRNDLVEQVMEILQESYPDITFRETADLISGYGKYSKLSDEQVKVILRDIKGQLQQISKLEDMQEGQPPLKTGVERRTPSDEERRLIKLVEEAKKKYNIKTTNPENQLKSALDSYKKKLKNQITDLESQIRDRQKIVKTRTALKLDREARSLLEKKNVLKEVFDSIFERPKIPLSQRIEMAEKSLEKSISVYEKKIEEGDISPITKKKDPVSTSKIEGLRTRRDALKGQLNNLRKMAKPKKTPQEIALQSLKTRLAGETKRLEDRIERLDFEKRQKSEIALDAEAQKLKWERDRIKAAYNAAKDVQEGITKEEVKKIVELAQAATEAQKKVVDSGDWTADNATDVEAYFDKKNEFEEYVENLKPTTKVDVANKFIDYFRASILASPRILRNSFLYQVVPGVERTITKRIVTGAFNDSDLKSNIIEKFLAKMSGIKPSAKSFDFIKRQAAMTIRIYHKTGIDISRLDKMDSAAKFFGERVRRFVGKSLLERYAKIVSLGPKWLAGGTDMLFASIGRADTAIMMSKEIAKIESLRGILPEGVTESQRADQLLKESYSFNPKDKRAGVIRDAGIMDAHMMNNTQPGWWSDKVIELRRMMKVGKLNFGKMFIPFAKIANVVVAEGVKTTTGYGIVKSLHDMNSANKSTNEDKRAKLMRDATTNLIRYVGLTAAALLIAATLDDDDYIGAYSTLGRKEYGLARARGAGASYVRIGGRWVPLRYLPMVNIPISAIMNARQAKKKGDGYWGGYAIGMVSQIMEAPGIKEVATITARIGYALKADNWEKRAKSMKLDVDGLSNWAKVRVIPSVISYDVWNHLFPQGKKYDFMGREIEKSSPFKEDKSNDITIEFSRLSNAGEFPVINDPSGKYAVALEEHLGEEEYADYLSGLKRNYSEEVSRQISRSFLGYEKLSDEKKKKRIDKIRRKKILNKIKDKAKELQE